MPEMGTYCKAYPVHLFRQYPAWTENIQQLQPDDSGNARTEIQPDDYLFLQEDFTVTDGIFLNEHIVFADVTDAWKEFCQTTLAFEIPADLLEPLESEIPAAESQTATPVPDASATAIS